MPSNWIIQLILYIKLAEIETFEVFGGNVTAKRNRPMRGAVKAINLSTDSFPGEL